MALRIRRTRRRQQRGERVPEPPAAIEAAIVLAHHAGGQGAAGLAAYTSARRPRTTAIARKAVATARLNMMVSRPGRVLRDSATAALSWAVPALLLRGFAGIADWRPPQRPYASVEAGARAGNR